MLVQNLLQMMDYLGLHAINLELTNSLSLEVFTIENVYPERKIIKEIRQDRSFVILDEFYNPDKIGLAIYKGKVHKYLIRAIHNRKISKEEQDYIFIILNNNFDKYYKLKKFNYNLRLLNTLQHLKNIGIQKHELLNLTKQKKLFSVVKNNYMILTSCKKLNGSFDFVIPLTNTINDDTYLIAEDGKGIITDTDSILNMFRLRLYVDYSKKILDRINEVRLKEHRIIKINITMRDIYTLLLLENIINAI